MKQYPIDLLNIGGDTYTLMSKGHHDFDVFMKEVREHYSWPLGYPEHLWAKTIPCNTGEYAYFYTYSETPRKGWFPVTYVSEAYGEDMYENIIKTKGEVA